MTGSGGFMTRRRVGRAQKQAAGTIAIPWEVLKVYRAFVKLGVVDIPYSVLKSIWSDTQFEPIWRLDRIYELLGSAILGCFDSLGPVYGKAGQVFLSRLSEKGQSIADRLRLTRLYGDWPPLDFKDVEKILDREIPHWRAGLRIDSNPLGVASMAQVHLATGLDGRQWAIKVIKPSAQKRLMETLAAVEQGISIMKSLYLTGVASRLIKELEEVSDALRREVHLGVERDNIDRVRGRLSEKKNQLLKIPKTYDEYCTDHVLTIEYFKGVPLTDLVTAKAKLPVDVRRKLAKQMLTELLVQVFEIGLFHGDPHAGNLILLEDGSVGLFDWGLTGELTDSDRRHISALLKAVIALDLDRLTDALVEMGKDGGHEVEPKEVKKTLQRLAKVVKKRKEAHEPIPMQDVLEESLKSAEKLGIRVPDGLLMMAKSLLTIEGLARGIDPEISLARIATPVLFKAAKPTLQDIWTVSKTLPKYAARWFSKSG